KRLEALHILMGHGRSAVQQQDFDLVILSEPLRPHLKFSHRRLDGNAGNDGAIGWPGGLVIGGFLGDVLAGR
ncbi:MAG: hypothetical protein RIR98_1626, partial [Bacteroidota bacterium]